ncbi:MAG: protein of unknown function endonuclease [Ilumatobacteraceae bacterium]|nr:protein of unknown function endonuclease [Ilumatobacteraceae bacterium]
MAADLRDQALRVAGRLDPEVMSGLEAAQAVEDLAVADKALAGTLLFVALRVAKTNAWRGQGFASAADWLASKVGISVREAQRQLGTARKAEDLGKTKDAMKNGTISPDQADAVADAASADPTAEDDLLDLAKRDTTRNLREEAARRKAAVTDTETRDRRIHRERSKRSWIDGEGAWNLRLRGTAADGARFEEAVRPFEEQAFRTGRSDAVRDTFDNRGYDAAMALCGIRPLPGTAVQPAPAGGAVTVKPTGGANTKVIVRIDHSALTRGNTVAGETCEVAGLGPISVTTAKDLMADAFLAAVITRGRDVINVAHLGRGPNVFQRTALEATGTACTNIGCNRTIAIEIDHRTPYADDPITKLDNLDPLCTTCHQLKTHHGHHLEPGTGRRRLLPPDHPDHVTNNPPGGDATCGQPALGNDPSPPLTIEQPTLC